MKQQNAATLKKSLEYILLHTFDALGNDNGDLKVSRELYFQGRVNQNKDKRYYLTTDEFLCRIDSEVEAFQFKVEYNGMLGYSLWWDGGSETPVKLDVKMMDAEKENLFQNEAIKTFDLIKAGEITFIDGVPL